MKKFIYFWTEIRSTFWFIPVLIILLALLMAFGLMYIDSIFDIPNGRTSRYLLIGSADSARSILTTISGAMIGVAGTVFSITLVALTLASSQFGSRLIRNFMYDKLNQVVLGTYISTFIYCLIVLNAIKDNDQLVFIPTFSIMFALLAAIGNIVLLIVFIHHIAVSIQADKVISDISESLSKNIESLFPEKMGSELDEYKEQDEQSSKAAFKKHQLCRSHKSGYIRYIDSNVVINTAHKGDLLIEIHFRPGEFVVYGELLATVYVKEVLDDSEIEELSRQFIIGKTRSQQQDPEHAIHQMVEIAARALSPGVNDPYTAIACIDNLTSTMSYLSSVKFPSRYRYDKDNNLRVIASAVTYEGMLDASFNQIRQYARGIPSVVIRLMEALITINKFTRTEHQKKAVIKHATMVLEMATETFEEQNDLKDLKERSQIILGAS